MFESYKQTLKISIPERKFEAMTSLISFKTLEDWAEE
jgi:hypothetical protein